MARLVCIGSGNLASHIMPALKSKGHEIVQIYGRSRKNKNELAKRLTTISTSSLRRIDKNADAYLFCVSDHAIQSIIEQIPFRLNKNQCAFHFSGTTNAEVLKAFAENYGVTWPIQTFTKGVELKLTSLPFCLTANNKVSEQAAKNIFKGIAKMTLVNDDQRRTLHLGAVIVNNFTNHLFHLTDEFLEKQNLDFNLLYPLIEETIRKAKLNRASNSQTGPASRNDLSTINQHLKLLKEERSLKSIYKLLTKNIQDQNA